MTDAPSRRIELAGPLNFRDVGGYPTADGSARVRWRRVFRSDSLFRVDDADAERLVSELGLLTIIDLRTDAEIARFGRGALESSGIDYHSVPIVDETQRTDPGFFVENTLEGMYLIMLRSYGDKLAEVLRLLAAGDNHPVVFHCAAGKDRTGLVTAVLLGILGVAEDDIVEDYALTAEIMPAMQERWRAYAERQGDDDPEERTFPPHAFLAEASILRSVLDTVHDEYGTLEDYARAQGVDDATMAALRRSLLEPLG